MFRCYSKLDRGDCLISDGCFCFCQDVITVIKSLEAELVVLNSQLLNFHPGPVSQHLLQLEFSAFQGLLLVAQLVDIQLIGKDDRRVAVVIDRSGRSRIRVVAVFQRYFVRIAVFAGDCVLIQRRSIIYRYNRVVQAFVCDLRASVAPCQLQREAMVGFCLAYSDITSCRLAVNLDNKCIVIIEGQAVLHLIREGQHVLLVLRDVARQLRCHFERYGIPDVIVRAVLPFTNCSGCIIDIHGLLIKLRNSIVVH